MALEKGRLTRLGVARDPDPDPDPDPDSHKDSPVRGKGHDDA